jgi:ABC-2 type transport system permease protein
MKATTIIAKKEFSENLRSTRFITLFGLFLFMLLLSAYQGTQDYKSELENYNELMGTDGADIPKPSILTVFQGLLGTRMGSGITIIGAIIGIVIGFDAVSGEREKGTLKFLLTQPLYRDTVINGKLLGFTLLIFTVVLISSIMTIAVVGGITGLFPGGDDAVRILVFNFMVFIYIMAFAVIGLFFSIFLKTGVDSLLAAISVFIIVTLLIGPIAQAVASSIAPVPSQTFVMRRVAREIASNQGLNQTDRNQGLNQTDRGARMQGWRGMGEETREASRKNREISQTIMYLSPSENFRHVNEVILDPYFQEMGGGTGRSGFGTQIQHSLSESLGMVWGNVVAILVWLAVFFIASYVMFLRTDVG